MWYRTRWIAALALVIGVASLALWKLGISNGGARWEQWRVPVAMVGVLIALAGLCVTSWQRTVANRRLTQVTAVAAAERVREKLIDGARRFNEARVNGNKDSAKFECLFLLFTIEAHIEDLAMLDLEARGPDKLCGGVLRVLAPGFHTGRREPAGPHFANHGFKKAGELANELNIMTM